MSSGRAMAENASRGLMVGLGISLFSAYPLGLAYRAVAKSHEKIPQELLGRHIWDEADFSLPISAEDVAATAALGVLGGFAIVSVCLVLQAFYHKHYRW